MYTTHLGGRLCHDGRMVAIKLQSIEFADVPFRKFHNLKIQVAERLTILAGHNGIGKSTLLALAAHASGVTGRGGNPADAHRSYFGRTFQSQFSEIIYLDPDREYSSPLAQGRALPAPLLTYRLDDLQLVKKCTLVQRPSGEVRLVPRNEPHQDFKGARGVGTESKVPLPTIYLGMGRMLPLGENQRSTQMTEEQDFDSADAELIAGFLGAVLPWHPRSSGLAPSIVGQSIKGTSKNAKYVQHDYSPRAISLGQDSLSSIATALASFNRLKRELGPDYDGGLLVVDEVDAGLHPRAQQLLVEQLQTHARRLHLQVIATTHSMVVIEQVHPDATPNARMHPDGVVYLEDTNHPAVRDDLSLQSIRADMHLVAPRLRTPKARPRVKVYLEDAEAKQFLKEALKLVRAQVTKATGVILEPVALNVGCENLKAFPKHDPYFSRVVIVLDADASLPRAKPVPNITRLPGGSGPDGKRWNPERTIYAFAENLVGEDDSVEDVRQLLFSQGVNRDQLRQHLLANAGDLQDRHVAKKWFRDRYEHIEDWGLVRHWLDLHPTEVQTFAAELIAAIQAALLAART